MSDSRDLAKAMKTALDKSGDLIKLRAQLKEELLEILNQQTQAATSNSLLATPLKKCKPAMPPEVILANNLIRQYLEYAGLQNTSSVLCAESGLPEGAISDSILQSKFPSLICFDGEPLLCSIIMNSTLKLNQASPSLP